MLSLSEFLELRCPVVPVSIDYSRELSAMLELEPFSDLFS